MTCQGHRISWCLGALLQSQWRASASANYGNKWFTGPLSKFQALLSELVYNTQANLGGVGAEMRFCIGTQQLLTWQEFVEELAARETGANHAACLSPRSIYSGALRPAPGSATHKNLACCPSAGMPLDGSPSYKWRD